MIKVDNISKTYELDNKDKVIGIKNISFEVKEGEILGIMGRSGSGKTTLLRLLRGVEELDEGSITVSDVTVRADDSQFYYNQLKKETAIHLQRSFGIWPETVRENVLRKLYARKLYVLKLQKSSFLIFGVFKFNNQVLGTIKHICERFLSKLNERSKNVI